MKDKRVNKTLLKIYDLSYKRFGPRRWWPGDTRFEIIIGAILTQNTAWGNVEKAIGNLKNKRLLNIKALSGIREKRLGRLIRPSGYYNIKARRVKDFLRFLDARYKNSLDRMFRTGLCRLREELLSVNGIGPETADSILLYAGGKPIFVVDAYTKRIFARHGFIDKDAGYADVQSLFMENLPEDAKFFNEFHALLVELGKSMCKSRKPLCSKCPIRRIKNAR